jgi:cell division protease FtsH
VAFEIDKEVRRIIDTAHEEARKILIKNKAQVEMIAKTLLEKETITSEEIAALTNPSVKVEEVETIVEKVAVRKKKVKNEA